MGNVCRHFWSRARRHCGIVCENLLSSLEKSFYVSFLAFGFWILVFGFWLLVFGFGFFWFVNGDFLRFG